MGGQYDDIVKKGKFIEKVYYLKWMANMVMVKHEKGNNGCALASLT